jgi:hypothetical protein
VTFSVLGDRSDGSVSFRLNNATMASIAQQQHSFTSQQLLDAAERSPELVAVHDKKEWLALFGPDAVVQDPVRLYWFALGCGRRIFVVVVRAFGTLCKAHVHAVRLGMVPERIQAYFPTSQLRPLFLFLPPPANPPLPPYPPPPPDIYICDGKVGTPPSNSTSKRDRFYETFIAPNQIKFHIQREDIVSIG